MCEGLLPEQLDALDLWRHQIKILNITIIIFIIIMSHPLQVLCTYPKSRTSLGHLTRSILNQAFFIFFLVLAGSQLMKCLFHAAVRQVREAEFSPLYVYFVLLYRKTIVGAVLCTTVLGTCWTFLSKVKINKNVLVTI